MLKFDLGRNLLHATVDLNGTYARTSDGTKNVQKTRLGFVLVFLCSLEDIARSRIVAKVQPARKAEQRDATITAL